MSSTPKESGSAVSRLGPLFSFLLLLLGLIAVNVVAAFLPLRADITKEGLYTLSDGSRNIVQSLEEPVTIKLYYSESDAEVPVSFKTYATKVTELLREFANASGGRVTMETYDPRPDTDEEEWAERYGVHGARLPSGNRFFFGMVAMAADQEAAVPFFDPRREKFLEYDVAQALSRVGQKKKSTIGLISSLPVSGFGGMPGAPPQQEWALVSELRKNYDVEQLFPEQVADIPEHMRLVILLHAKGLPERVSYALDQFLLRGGKLMVLVDPNSRLDPGAQQQFGIPTSSDLDTLFKAWGIRYDAKQVVGDHKLATRVNSPQQGIIEYPVWVTLTAEYLNKEQVITSELEEITLIDSGAFEPAEDFAYAFTPLMTSSDQSAFVDFTTVRMVNPVTIAKMIKPDGKRRTLAALVTGTFNTAYPGGPPPEPPAPPPQAGRPPQVVPTPQLPHLVKGEQESSVLLVGDSDFIADQFSIRTVNFFGTAIPQPLNDNLNFALNSVEFLMGSQNLIHIRSRGQFSRPFTHVQELQVQAAQQYLQEEQRLSEHLESVKRQLGDLERQKPQGQQLILSAEQLEAVKRFREEERDTRRALRDVRKVLRQDIETLGNVLLLLNLLAMPALVGLFGFVFIYRRGKRSGGGK